LKRRNSEFGQYFLLTDTPSERARHGRRLIFTGLELNDGLWRPIGVAHWIPPVSTEPKWTVELGQKCDWEQRLWNWGRQLKTRSARAVFLERRGCDVACSSN
jgi:hypothetical protein